MSITRRTANSTLPTFTLRLAVPGDVRSTAEVQTATWKVAYAGPIPSSYLAALSAAEREPVWRNGIEGKRYTITVAEVEGEVAGFSAYGKSRDIAEFHAARLIVLVFDQLERYDSDRFEIFGVDLNESRSETKRNCGLRCARWIRCQIYPF